MTNFGEDIEKMRNVYTFGESVIQAATMKILKKKKKKKGITTSGYLSEGSKNTNSKRYMHLHIYCNIIYIYSNMDATRYYHTN